MTWELRVLIERVSEMVFTAERVVRRQAVKKEGMLKLLDALLEQIRREMWWRICGRVRL